MDWDSAVIQDINQRRKKERELAPEMAEREDNLLRLMSRSLYGEKVHYALELIQNAEDAGASSISFIFEKDKVIVVNDGEAFTPDDVDAICSVKPGRKKNKIGFFGVGFKSVFNITNNPQVISSRFNFQIDDYIYPRPLDSVPNEAKDYYSKDRCSIFVLPQSESLPSIPEVLENFKELDDKILLFLDQLKTLHFIDNIHGERWSIERLPSKDSLVILRDGRDGKTTKWMVFHEDLKVSSKDISIPEGKEGITNTRITIALPADEDTRETNKGSRVYCYLPTDKRSDMPFLVQADFVPTVGRGNIQEVEWNKWLLRRLGALAAEAVEQVKDDPSMGKRLYSFIPLKDEVEEPLMSILSETMYDSLKGRDVAKTIDEDWRKPAECVIAGHPLLTEIIPQVDLAHIFKGPLSYIDIGAPERAQQIMTELGANTLSESEFVEFLGKEELLRKRKPRWFLDAYAYLNEVFNVAGRNYWEEEEERLFSQLEKTKFILTSQDELVPLKDKEKPDMLICYPQSMDLSEVNALFTEGEIVFLNRFFQLSTIIKRKNPDSKEEEKRKKVGKFFEDLGVRKHFRQSHVIKDVILPKYSSGKYRQYDDARLYSFLNYIRAYWSTIQSDVRNKKISESIFDDIGNTVRVKCYSHKNGEQITGYLPPGKIYFSNRYGKKEEMEALYKDVEDIWFLHPYYLNREKRETKKARRGRQRAEYGWKRFAEILGVWSSPRVEKDNSWVSISGKSEYDWVEKRHSSRGLHDIYGDSVSTDLQRLIEFCAAQKDAEITRDRMIRLFTSLSSNWKKYKEHCQARYRYYYYDYNHVVLNSSSFLNYLRNAKWIPTVEGDFCKPEDAFLDSERNRSLLGEDVKFVGIEGNQDFLEDIGINLEPEISQVLEHLKKCSENNDGLGKGKLGKYKEIYSFIAEKVSEGDEADLKELRKEFDAHQLLYLPRKDRTWWTPKHVFWREHSRVFGQLRGYIEHKGTEIYPATLKEFMLSLGVSERPSIRETLEVLEELRAVNDLETLKSIVAKAYSYIDDTLSHDNVEEIDWENTAFLTKTGEFHPPDRIYYEDDEEYAKAFHDKAQFIYVPISWTGLRSFFRSAGFKSLADSLTIVKHLGALNELEGGQLAQVIKSLSFVKNYLANKNLEAHERLSTEGLFDQLADVEVYETNEIRLDISLDDKDNGPITVTGMEKVSYYSIMENRLYLLKGLSPFSSQVAKELSRIFKGSENDVFPFLNAILPMANDEDSLQAQLKLFGIEEKEEQHAGTQQVELIPLEEELEVREEEKVATKEEEMEEEPTVEPPPAPSPRKGLIRPEDYFPSKRKEYIPYVKTEGEAPLEAKEISLREGRRGTPMAPKEPPHTAGSTDAEGIAIQMVINYEATQGREAEDRHRQKGIGYDVYSKKDDGEEMFIEVKHFGEQPGGFRLTPHQLKKARIEGNKYYVYVLAGLREGDHPKVLYIIQDPVRWLTPDPPVQQEYSDWNGGVKHEVTFENA